MNETDHRKSLGQSGEEIATWYLKSLGYKITALNYECKRGEIDIIAQHGDIIVFVEVKTRRAGAYKQPYITVTREKEKKILRIADYYLYRNRIKGTRTRFDVISIVLTHPTPQIKHIRAAFGTWKQHNHY